MCKGSYPCSQYVERILPMFPIRGKDPNHVPNTWKGSYPCSQYVGTFLVTFPVHGKVPTHVILRKMHDVSGVSVMLIPLQTGEEWNRWI